MPVVNYLKKVQLPNNTEYTVKDPTFFTGTTEEWNLLSTEEKQSYQIVNLTDDEQEGDISEKADKVTGATAGNLAGLDSNGNLTDSGVAASSIENLGTASTYDVPESGDASDDEVVKGDDTRLGNIKGNNTVLQTDKTPFLSRQVLNPTGFSGYVREKLIGASYAWNQLVENGNFANGTTDWTIVSRLTPSVSANVLTITVNTVGDIYADAFYTGIKGHKYLLIAKIKQASTISGTFGLRTYYNGTADYETVYGIKDNAWHTFAVIISETTGGLSNRLRIFEQNAALNDTAQVCDCQCIDLTLAFGSTIADYLYGLSNNGGITKLRDMGFPIDKYTPYGYGLYSVKTSGKKIVGKNLVESTNLESTRGYYNASGTFIADNDEITTGLISVLPNTTYIGSIFNKSTKERINNIVYTLWSSTTECQGQFTTETVTTLENTKYIRIRNYGSDRSYLDADNFLYQLEQGSSTSTTYEPYCGYEISLGNDELRGKFDLVNGEIVASGDVKESNGEITRRMKRVEANSLSWYMSSTSLFYTVSGISDKKPTEYSNPSIITCSKYAYTHRQGFAVSDKEISDSSSSGYTTSLFIKDTAYTDLTSFVNSLSGIYLEYELATPTTEQSTPFADPMSLVGATTEEYIDTRDIPCPVGAERQYMGESNDVIPIPSSPMSDGDSVLHCQKSGNEAQYYWEGVSGSTFGIGLAITFNTNYTIPSDGYVVLSCGYPASEYVLLKLNRMNAQTIRNADNGGNNGPNYACVFVRKGMIVNVTGSTSATATFLPVC